MTRYIVFLWLTSSTLLTPCPDVLANSGKDASDNGLSILQEFLTDQKVFEQKVRAFDKLYVGLARASYKKAKSLEQAGNDTEVQRASEQAQRYLRLVKSAYDMGLTHFDTSAILHNYYGELVHDYFGQPDEAAHRWKRATQLDPEFARARCNYGMYAFHNGMYSTGIENMDAAIRLKPNDPDFLFNMAQAYLVHSLPIMQLRKWDRTKIFREAMKLSEKAARLLPDDFELSRDYALNYFLGEEHGVNVNWKDAAKAWQTARNLAQTDAEVFNAWLNEARVHKRNDDKKKALECLNKAQSVWPDSPVVKQLINDFRE